MDQANASTEVIVNTKDDKHGLLPNKLLVSGAVLIIAIVVVGVLFLVRDHNNHHDVSYSTLARMVSQYNAERNYEASVTLITRQSYASESRVQDMLATTYLSWSKPSKALSVYASLSRSNNLTADDAENAGIAAADVKNYSLAANYYNKAASLQAANDNTPVGNTNSEYDRQQAIRFEEMAK
jgi:hypothetical protein